MSLIRRKDRKRYMFELLPPETWQEASRARLGEDWDLDESDKKHAALMERMHKSSRDHAIEKLQRLFEPEGGFDIDQFKILDVIPVLYMGWECDYLAWVVKHKGKRYVIGTNHGSLHFKDVAELRKHVFDYEQAITHTNKAILELEA